MSHSDSELMYKSVKLMTKKTNKQVILCQKHREQIKATRVAETILDYHEKVKLKL